MPATTFPMSLSFPAVPSTYLHEKGVRICSHTTWMRYAYLDLDDTLVIAVPEERMRVFRKFSVIWDLNAGPAQLLDGDERLGDVRILRHEERAEMQGKFLSVEDVG